MINLSYVYHRIIFIKKPEQVLTRLRYLSTREKVKWQNPTLVSLMEVQFLALSRLKIQCIVI